MTVDAKYAREELRSVKQGNVQTVLPMIAKKARATYNKLPMSMLSATSVQDLISEGRIFAVTYVVKKFDPKRGIKFSTFLFHALDNFYKDVLEAAYADKRYVKVYSLDSSVVSGTKTLLIDRLSRSRSSLMEDKLIARIDAERAFLRAYAVSSYRLRLYLINWFLKPNDNRMKEGIDLALALAEFQQGAASKFITEETAETIETDYVCKLRIANSIASNFVTPTHGRASAVSYRHTIERKVLPLLSEDRQRSMVVFSD